MQLLPTDPPDTLTSAEQTHLAEQMSDGATTVTPAEALAYYLSLTKAQKLAIIRLLQAYLATLAS